MFLNQHTFPSSLSTYSTLLTAQCEKPTSVRDGKRETAGRL